MNKVQLIGNLGRDPEIRTMQNGNKVCSLALATSDSWKDKESGERKEATEWHRVSVFNPHLVDVADKYLRKGSKVYVEGQLKTRKWQDKDGQDRYTTEVILGRFKGAMELLDRAPEREGERAGAGTQSPPDTGAAAPLNYPDDDEIPF